MSGTPKFDWRILGLRTMAVVMGLAMFVAQLSVPVSAAPNERILWLYHTHTGQTAKFTYWRNGKYDRKVIDQMNVFLADWRTKAKANMDPALFDLLWTVYQEVGGKQPYNIVSSYREPKTNAMLASKSSGVAENSQHMVGKAMDVFIPGVKLSTLRATAMRYQVGGVGYYPTSGSPFVHMDTGSVRAWPRMTRAQLKQVFPDGKTLHLPVDGTPLSNQGRAYAQAEWNKCKMVPCNGMSTPAPAFDSGEPTVMLASLEPVQRSVPTIEVTAPVPMMRRPQMIAGIALDPANNPFGSMPSAPLAAPDAIVPFSKSPAMMVATRGALPLDGTTALGAIDETAPVPRILMTPRQGDVLTAYAPDIAPDEGAQRALEILIQRETAAADLVAPAEAEPLVDTSEIRIASLGSPGGVDVVQNIFDMTWTAVTEANAGSAIASTLVSASLERDTLVGLKPREFDLVAPEMDHVNDTLVMPVAMTDTHFAEFYEPEGYLDNAAELGSMANRVMLEPDNTPPPRYDTFVIRRPLLVASR